jgi:hypothetical protein
MSALLRDEEPLDGEAARLITTDAHTLAEMLELLPRCFRRYAIANTEIDIVHEVEVCRENDRCDQHRCAAKDFASSRASAVNSGADRGSKSRLGQ